MFCSESVVSGTHTSRETLHRYTCSANRARPTALWRFMPSEDEGDVAMLPVAADHAYEHKDGAPIVQLMASVFSELRLTEVSGGVEPSAAAGFFSRKGLERIGQLRKED